MNSKVRTITRSAIFLALLIIAQVVTKSFGQLLTGSLVNAILILTVVFCGFIPGVLVAIVSPFLALALGIGPIIQIVPFIAIGNLVITVVTGFIYRKLYKETNARNLIIKIIAAIIGSFAKFGVIYLGVVVLLLPSLDLPAAQVAKMSTMFAWPQLFTALIGAGIAYLITIKAPNLKK